MRKSNLWYIFCGIFVLVLGYLSLVDDLYPQFPSMCIILGIILSVTIDTMDTIPPIATYHWHMIWDDMRSGKISFWR